MKLRTRQLQNGKWIAEVKKWYGWRAIWFMGDVLWLESAGNRYYYNCFKDSEREALEILNEYKSRKGL
jgi:hypothetical protein